jgi:hypothetical protein
MSDYYQNAVEIAGAKQRLYEETVSALQNEERFKTYFSGFDENTVQSFIEHYARMKAQWHENGETMVRLRNHHQRQWKLNAFEMLEQIQHKKLFNVECLWRAERTKLQQVNVTFDFYKWRHDVLDCPFLEPVSEEELSVYKEFLSTLPDDKKFKDVDVGNSYYNLKDNNYRDYPLWYSFYDSYYKTAYLLSLPDLRTEKEEYYRELWRKEQGPKWASGPRDKRPMMRYLHEKDFAEWFLAEFETKETLKLYRSTKQWDEKNERTEEIEMDLINLGEADRTVPVEEDEDWRKGIKRAAERYYRERTLEVLDEVWKLYCSRKAAGRPAREAYDYSSFHTEWDNSTSDRVVEQILRGRELDGKPRDLNF